MSNYTLVTDLNDLPPQQLAPPAMPVNEKKPSDQFDILKKYLKDDQDDDSDEEESVEEDDEEDNSKLNWVHVYGTIIVVLLAIIIFFLYKIHFDVHSSS